MTMSLAKPEAPSDDKRWRIVDATMRRNGYSRHAMIESLHSVQDSFGYLDTDSLRYVSDCLRVPLSAVYGVATFYHLFSLKPKGKHNCVVCSGTACYIKNASELIESVRDKLGVAPGETTQDGLVSLLTARCIGACSMAPAVVCDGQMYGEMTAQMLDEMLEGWSDDDA